MPLVAQLLNQVMQHMADLFDVRFKLGEALFCGLAAHCFILSLSKL